MRISDLSFYKSLWCPKPRALHYNQFEFWSTPTWADHQHLTLALSNMIVRSATNSLGHNKPTSMLNTKKSLFQPRPSSSMNVPVHPFVRPSVYLQLFSWRFSHHIITKSSGVITIDQSDIHAKGKAQWSEVNVTEVKNVPVWPFLDLNSSLNSQMAAKWRSKLEVL